MLNKCFRNHTYTVTDIEMSRRDPPKAFYTCQCDDCGKIIEGHAHELADTVESIENLDVDGLPPSMMEIKESYLNGDFDDIEFEMRLNDILDL